MSKVFEFMLPYAHILTFAVLLLFVEAVCALLLPGFMADIVNQGVLVGNIAFIWRTGFVMLAITLLSVSAALTMSYFSARTATGVANDMRAAVFDKVLHFSNAELNKFAASSLITRTTNDITQIQTIMLMAIRLLIYAPILGVGGIIRALDRSVDMTWTIALATLCMVGMMAVLMVVAMPKFKALQGLIDRLNLVSRENLNGILIVRAFNTQKFEKQRFDKANKELAATNLFVDQSFAFLMPGIMLVLNVTTAAIVWVGAHQASAFRIDIGDIFAFLQYGMLIIFAFMMVALIFIYVPRALVSAGRVKEVLETETSLVFRENAVPLPSDFRGEIEFKGVSFRYPDALESDENVLNNISFTAVPGKTTAIIGATGSGKTSILQLMLRFYDTTGGAIFYDGIDIRDLDKEELHKVIGYIPQKAHLFSGTIRSNLLYADKDATEERLQKAVEIAQAAAFIAEKGTPTASGDGADGSDRTGAKTSGYDAHVSQGGTNFSGGQRQRLSIARALVKAAPIYLFDDSFSALDLKTDALLRAALKNERATKIIVAQRISTIMDADQIIVLEHGRIAGAGKHHELMRTSDIYREIAASQLTEEERNGGSSQHLNRPL